MFDDKDLPNYCPSCAVQLIRPNEEDDYYSPLRIINIGVLEKNEYHRFECGNCNHKFCYHTHSTRKED